jgi:hypothetical protein
MKKRAMKKWIPKNTSYCYENKNIKSCKWLSFNKTKDEQLSGYCKYLHSGDWMEDGTTLLWDECKECSCHYENSLYWLRQSKKKGKRKGNK